MAKKKKERLPIGNETPINNPFGGLAALRAQMGDAPRAPAAAVPEPEPEAVPLSDAPARTIAKVVLRRESKGRSGKTVTRATGLTLDGAALDRLAKELKTALGCGATVEGSDLVIQGSQCERAAAFFKKKGTKRVIVGN